MSPPQKNNCKNSCFALENLENKKFNSNEALWSSPRSSEDVHVQHYCIDICFILDICTFAFLHFWKRSRYGKRAIEILGGGWAGGRAPPKKVYSIHMPGLEKKIFSLIGRPKHKEIAPSVRRPPVGEHSSTSTSSWRLADVLMLTPRLTSLNLCIKGKEAAPPSLWFRALRAQTAHAPFGEQVAHAPFGDTIWRGSTYHNLLFIVFLSYNILPKS